MRLESIIAGWLGLRLCVPQCWTPAQHCETLRLFTGTRLQGASLIVFVFAVVAEAQDFEIKTDNQHKIAHDFQSTE